MKQILLKAFSSIDLTKDDIEYIIEKIDSDSINQLQLAALIGAISAKKNGISPLELSYFVKSLKKKSNTIQIESNKPLMDICGTGGDCLGTFNISTACSFILASCGIGVVKHGSRSVSSSCGSADVLEYLGVDINPDINKINEILSKTGMVFLYAPNFNTTMAKIKKFRNELKVPTIFNLLGPLINPVKLDYQLIGIFDEKKCRLIADSMCHLDLKGAMVVHSQDGLDEVSTTSDNILYEYKNNNVSKFVLPPFDELGIKKSVISDIQGGSVKTNAEIILDILNGNNSAKSDIVILNSAVALLVAKKAKNIFDAIALAKESIKSGAALNVLERLKNVSK